MCYVSMFFFFNDTATTEIYTLSLHDALPIFVRRGQVGQRGVAPGESPDDIAPGRVGQRREDSREVLLVVHDRDRKSTRLNSSHANISYAVFCLKKKKQKEIHQCNINTNTRLS